MFGIGFWEMLMISGLVLIAVGPERLPGMIKSVARLYRQMRRAALDIRQSTGIDDVLRDEELKELAAMRHQKIQLMEASKKSPAAAKPGVQKPVAPEGVVARDKPVVDKPVVDKPVAKPVVDKPVHDKPMPAHEKPVAYQKPVASHGISQRPEPLRGLSLEDRRRELPLEGVDVAHARARFASPSVPKTRDAGSAA